MTVTVVPALRLRRATTGWSYKVSDSAKIQPGALVIVPFRGHPTPGIVWDTEETGKATLSVSEVLTKTPLVRAPQRALIEWLADEALCSLSTALYTWLPSSLRSLPFTASVKEVLSTWDASQPTAKAVALAKQHAVLTPSQRFSAENSLTQKYGGEFSSTFADTTPAQEFQTWVDIAQGKVHLATGRERALFAPWLNLRHVTIIEPEDISYQSGQSPYFNAVKGAEFLAQTTQSELKHRTNIPVIPARLIWNTATGLPISVPNIELTDLRKERMVSERLIEAIKKILSNGKEVVLLYNAHDRTKPSEDGTRIVIPGIETIGKQIASHFDGVLPSGVHLGTRSLLSEPLSNVGLSIILSLDPLLYQTSFADQLHGWGDIGRLCHLGAPLIVQTRTPEHALPQSLEKGTFEEYCASRITEAKEAGLPPFSEHIVCATPEDHEAALNLFRSLEPLIKTPWHISYPRVVLRRGKSHTIITINAPLKTRLPLAITKQLAQLPRPWKVERSPWYAG